jgi:hypothetical protein
VVPAARPARPSSTRPVTSPQARHGAGFGPACPGRRWWRSGTASRPAVRGPRCWRRSPEPGATSPGQRRLGCPSQHAPAAGGQLAAMVLEQDRHRGADRALWRPPPGQRFDKSSSQHAGLTEPASRANKTADPRHAPTNITPATGKRRQHLSATSSRLSADSFRCRSRFDRDRDQTSCPLGQRVANRREILELLDHRA